MFCKAPKPIATLRSAAIFDIIASFPIATFELPIVFDVKVLYPKVTLSPPVVIASPDKPPINVFLCAVVEAPPAL